MHTDPGRITTITDSGSNSTEFILTYGVLLLLNATVMIRVVGTEYLVNTKASRAGRKMQVCLHVGNFLVRWQ